jgi:hypothetical protein
MQPDNELMTTKEAAAFLKVSSQYLDIDRCRHNQSGVPPKVPFLRILGRTIRYRRSDLEAILQASRVS